ncbi:hypothetical protein D9M71_342130 [compost metagenome]
MADAGEDADDLEVALHAHQVAGAAELGEIGLDRNPGRAGLDPVAFQPTGNAFLRPAEEGVLEQAGDVVGDRTVDRVLEIQHARVRGTQHQVARHVVAMHQHLGLGQGAADQQVGNALPGRQALALQLDPQVTLQVPLGEQLQFATQQGIVIAGHGHVEAALLERQQRLQGVIEQCIGVFGIDDVKVGLASQVIEDQEALLDIGSQDAWHVHARLGEHAGHLDEGAAVLARRRRVHQDQGAAVGLPAEVTTKARVAAGRNQRGGRHGAPAFISEQGGQLLVQPLAQLLKAQVFMVHRVVSGGASRCAGHALLSSIFFSPSRGVRPSGPKARRKPGLIRWQ